jgi:hypothetical protein
MRAVDRLSHDATELVRAGLQLGLGRLFDLLAKVLAGSCSTDILSMCVVPGGAV